MKAKCVICIFILFTILSSVFGQELPSVDIETATTQIEQFQSENEQLAKKIAILIEANQILESDAKKWNGWAEAIQTIIIRIKDRAQELIDILSEIAVKAIMEKAQEVLDRYSRIRALLESKAESLQARVEDANASIQRNLSTIEELSIKIARNERNVELLIAAIRKSKSRDDELNYYIDNLEDALKAAEELLETTN